MPLLCANTCVCHHIALLSDMSAHLMIPPLNRTLMSALISYSHNAELRRGLVPGRCFLTMGCLSPLCLCLSEVRAPPCPPSSRRHFGVIASEIHQHSDCLTDGSLFVNFVHSQTQETNRINQTGSEQGLWDRSPFAVGPLRQPWHAPAVSRMQVIGFLQLSSCHPRAWGHAYICNVEGHVGTW